MKSISKELALTFSSNVEVIYLVYCHCTSFNQPTIYGCDIKQIGPKGETWGSDKECKQSPAMTFDKKALIWCYCTDGRIIGKTDKYMSSAEWGPNLVVYSYNRLLQNKVFSKFKLSTNS